MPAILAIRTFEERADLETSALFVLKNGRIMGENYTRNEKE
jgi:hypothetical protein